MIGILLAAATIAVNSVSQNPVTRTVSVNYTVSGESAVVTLDAVTTNGTAMAAADLFNVAGDANRLVGVGSHTLLWQPPVAAGFGPFAANAVEISLQAWATNAPPDYMVIDLELPDRVRYVGTETDIQKCGCVVVVIGQDGQRLRRVQYHGF